MEKSYIKFISNNFLKEVNINKEQINEIQVFINYAIKEHLYTYSKVMYHDLKHIERVLIYAMGIINSMNIKFSRKDLNILMYSILFHDSGRSLGAKDKDHGIIGAKVAYNKLNEKLDKNEIKAIMLLIKTHAVNDDKVYFDYEIKEKDKKKIQLLSNILKDSDALDRNRLKLFPFWKCNPKYLRTDEAIEIFKKTDKLYKEYCKAVKKQKN